MRSGPQSGRSLVFDKKDFMLQDALEQVWKKEDRHVEVSI